MNSVNLVYQILTQHFLIFAGLYKGMRVSDYATGWFPAKCVTEVLNDHVRARNLKQRHQVLSKVEARINMQKLGK